MGIAKLSLLKKKAAENYAPLAQGQEAHWEVVQRILFLYAKLNPGQSYVQGMNEICGVIYYVLANQDNPMELRGDLIHFHFYIICISHYSKSQIFVQKFNFDNTPTFHEFFTQIIFDNFSREIKVVNS